MDHSTGASNNALGVKGRKYLLPACSILLLLQCSTVVWVPEEGIAWDIPISPKIPKIYLKPSKSLFLNQIITKLN